MWLAKGVTSDLRELRSARNDSIQWTLSQVEIEYLDFCLTIQELLHEDKTDLNLLRKDFDILFSRHNILENGAVFSEVRNEPAFTSALAEVSSFLERNIPLIDGDDASLQSALKDIQKDAQSLRASVRQLYVTGLGHFADASDGLRNQLSATLLKLSAATTVLILFLIWLSAYSRNTAAKSRVRGRELARANTHMKTILSTSLDGVIVSDKTGCVVDFNAAAETIFGYKLEDIKGQSIGNLIVPPDMRAAHEKGMQRMLTTGEKRLVGHGRIRIDACRADGSVFPVELALENAEGADGEIIIAFLRDISAQVEAEEELRQARDQALAGEKAKADFLTVMSHEIRTPLNGLLGNLSLMGNSRMTKTQTQFHENMEISGRQLMKHVNAVLDVARFEAGKLVIEETRFHVGEFLQDLVNGQSGLAENRNTAIGWAWVGPELDWVKTDKAHLERILLNLLGNAIKFTENGRVHLEIEQVDRVGNLLPTVEIRIIDTGVGIADSDQIRIFEDFETTGSISSVAGSTGLGLGIAKRLVELLDGEIGVESTVGEGSVFWLRFPLKTSHKPVDQTNAQSTDTATSALNILLAEDNDMNAFVVRNLLESEGHQISWVEDGEQAVEAIKSDEYDVVLMDINMPKLDGLEATKRIRDEVPKAADTPIFAFSANVLPDDTTRFRENGMDGFIAKPIQIDELRAALSAVSKGRVGLVESSRPTKRENGAKGLFGDDYPSFLERFLDEGDTLVAWLAQEGSDNLADTAQRCHKISSTAALFGATNFHTALVAMEVDANKRARVSVETRIGAISDVWETTKTTLTKS